MITINKYDSLVQQTLRLLELNEKIRSLLNKKLTMEGVQPDFYGEVKPFADMVNEEGLKWKELATQWVMKERPKYIHTMQIETTLENLTNLSVSVFYPDLKVKRSKATIESIKYNLEAVIQQIEKKTLLNNS
ncbi:YppE family protein [Bacillus timonensis]|nr:YppE family protein [Bacillus timonensis]